MDHSAFDQYSSSFGNHEREPLTMDPNSWVAAPDSGREDATQVALETVAEGGPLAGVLGFLCRTMEEQSVDRVIACIHPLNEDGTVFRDTVAPSLDKSYRDAVEGVRVSSMLGPCCYAVATRQTVMAPELAADPKWIGFRQFAEPLGIRSCWSTPIFSSDGRVLGTFAHYYFEARDPSPGDAGMVDLMTRAAAVAIERSRAEAALRELNDTLEQRVHAETRERLRIWNVSQDLLVIAGLDGTVLSVNPAWTAMLGWSEADLLGKSYNWLLHPDDRERTATEFDHLVKGHKTLRFEARLGAKDAPITGFRGTRRRTAGEFMQPDET
jgi:PAS domain-containing protein